MTTPRIGGVNGAAGDRLRCKTQSGPGGDPFSRASSISPDGSIIVGRGEDDAGQTVAIWEADFQIQRLDT